MDTFLTFTVLGLVLGAVYAIAASGLVLTYNTSGVFNFAHGAQAMLGAFMYWQFSVGWGLPVWLSVVLTVGVLGPVMGAALYTLLMRGLRGTAEVTKIVVTVAVLLGFVYLSQWIWPPEEARILGLFFGSNASIEVFGVVIRAHEIICLVLAVAIAVGLRLLFHRTRVGVAMRGVVDDPDLLQLTGHDPERVALLSWVMGSVLAVLAGILITPIGGGAPGGNAPAPPGFGARRAGRHPDHPDRRWRAGGQRADAAGDRCVRRRDVRPPPQHPAHVRGCNRARHVGHIPGRICAGLLDLGRQLPGHPADDHSLHRAARAPAGPTARSRHANPRAVCGAHRPQGRRLGRGPRRSGLVARPAHGARIDHDIHTRHDLRGHGPVVDPAHRLRRRDEPRDDGVRGHRHDRRLPRGHRRGRPGVPADLVGRGVRRPRDGPGRRAGRPPGSAAARALPGVGHAGLRRGRREHGPAGHQRERPVPRGLSRWETAGGTPEGRAGPTAGTPDPPSDGHRGVRRRRRRR